MQRAFCSVICLKSVICRDCLCVAAMSVSAASRRAKRARTMQDPMAGMGGMRGMGGMMMGGMGGMGGMHGMMGMMPPMGGMMPMMGGMQPQMMMNPMAMQQQQQVLQRMQQPMMGNGNMGNGMMPQQMGQSQQPTVDDLEDEDHDDEIHPEGEGFVIWELSVVSFVFGFKRKTQPWCCKVWPWRMVLMTWLVVCQHQTAMAMDLLRSLHHLMKMAMLLMTDGLVVDALLSDKHQGPDFLSAWRPFLQVWKLVSQQNVPPMGFLRCFGCTPAASLVWSLWIFVP